jgi:hypothetical protein
MLRSEKTRQLVWGWLKENYKTTYLQLHPNFRNEYKDIAMGLKDYFGPAYKPAVVQKFLRTSPDRFAYTNPMNPNKPMPFRKTAAFVERLVYVHHVMSIEDARRWVQIITSEVLSWP